MNTVTIARADLIETITANREQHRAQFLQAQAGYRRRMIEELDRMLDDAKAGRRFERYISLPEPEDHTDDYDRVIKMLQMSVDDTITITSQDFGKYVMDDWSWKGVFAATNSAYGVGLQGDDGGARAGSGSMPDPETYELPRARGPVSDIEHES